MKKLLLVVVLMLTAAVADAALSVTNVAPSSITSTSAVLGASCTGTNTAMPSLFVWYGLSNGGTSTSSWTRVLSLGTAPDVNTNITSVVSNLTAGVWYARAAAQDGTNYVWAATGYTFTVVGVGIPVRTNDFTGIALTDEAISDTSPVTLSWSSFNVYSGATYFVEADVVYLLNTTGDSMSIQLNCSDGSVENWGMTFIYGETNATVLSTGVPIRPEGDPGTLTNTYTYTAQSFGKTWRGYLKPTTNATVSIQAAIDGGNSDVCTIKRSSWIRVRRVK